MASIPSAACDRQITYTRPSGKSFKRHVKQECGYDDDLVSVLASINAIAKFGVAATTDTLEKLVGRKSHTLKQWRARALPAGFRG